MPDMPDPESSSESKGPSIPLTTTQAKKHALLDLVERAGCPKESVRKVSVELVHKFKWIAKAIGLFLDMTRIIIAYSEREDEPGSPRERQYYDQIVQLHPEMPEMPRLFKYASTQAEVAVTLANIIEFHMTESKNNDTNTLRYTIISYLPLNPKHDVVQPPISGDSKADRGFNHPATAAALTPLKYRSKFQRDQQAFMDMVNAGEVLITHKLWPSVMYPNNVQYDRNCISEELFQSHVIVRAMRAIFHGKSSAFDGKRSGSKASQAEMHGMERPTPASVAYVALHVVFALSNIENWARADDSSFDYYKFYVRVKEMFQDPEDDWTTETLDFLASEMPVLRAKKGGKRKRRDEDELLNSEEDNESDDELRREM
ncbi:hypothetical protein CVT24_012270 [Panaeolus cyanescens]|uniref:Uncharacterized protein n=1 Tax=Panaeolus cyanescens TaxID=181874 RepID=A0A409WE62_9AGAR|nr:hypothetical protein CVT24_012270 [Panaeolus cyanescens]